MKVTRETPVEESEEDGTLPGTHQTKEASWETKVPEKEIKDALSTSTWV